MAHDVLLVASVIYMLWLAWKIAHAAPPAEAGTEPQGRPLSFVQAAAFQWVNPKAWSMALGAITLYATGRDLGSVMLVAGTYVAMSVISTSTWTVLGREMLRQEVVNGADDVVDVCLADSFHGYHPREVTRR